MPEDDIVLPSSSAARGAEPSHKDPLISLASQLRRASPGTLAPLRRIHPWKPGRAGLFESEWMLQSAGITAEGDARERWALVLHCLAIAQARHSPGADYEPGRVLARQRVSEARIKQLIEADGEVLADLMPRLARRLAGAGVTMNWWPLVDLLLYTGTANEARADQARRRIVTGYLAAHALAGDTHTYAAAD